MILPKGQSVYENLVSRFVNLGNLLEFLEEDYFSGYLDIDIAQAKGIIFMENGELVNASYEDPEGGEKATGGSALSLILDKSSAGNGIISIYRLNSDTVKVIATVISSELLYHNLSTEFSDLQKMIARMGKEKTSGYIDLLFSNNREKAIIFFQEGRPVECLISLVTGNVLSGIKMLPKIVEQVNKIGAVFHVYRRTLEPNSNNARARSIRSIKEIVELLDLSFDVVNSVVNKALGIKSFEKAFNETCLEMADKYPFMDPFADEIYFRDGRLKIDSHADLSQVLQATNECLQRTLERLSSSAENLLPEIHRKAQAAFADVQDKLVRWQFAREIPLLFETAGLG